MSSSSNNDANTNTGNFDLAAVTPTRKASATQIFSKAAAVASSINRTSKLKREKDTTSSSLAPVDSSHSNPSRNRQSAKEKSRHKAKSATLHTDQTYPKDGSIDATVLQYETTIMIQSPVTSTTIAVTTKMESGYQACMEGSAISQGRECLRIIPIHNDVPRLSFTSPSANTNEIITSSTVRYGHTIALQSCTNQRSLGIRGTEKVEIGFYRTILGQAEQWTILPMDEKVELGNTVFQPGKPVRSGQPIILKNMLSGGLLSLDGSNDGRLSIITRTIASMDGIGSEDFINEIQPTEREEFFFNFIHVPPCPDWVQRWSRAYLDGTFFLHEERNDDDLLGDVFTSSNRRSKNINTRKVHRRLTNDKHPIGGQKKAIQEGILVEEVLGCLMGLEGKHLGIAHNGSCWKEHGAVKIAMFGCENVDVNLLQAIELILPTCEAYIEVNAYVSRCLSTYEYGRVCHALCGAIDTLLKEYLELIVSLEDTHRLAGDESSELLTMNALQAHILSPSRIMLVLQHIVREVKVVKGGALLNKLENLLTAKYLGDDRATRMIRFLLERSSVPYMDMLKCWLDAGFLKDPYSEFMIQQNISTEKIRKGTKPNLRTFDEDWHRWFVVRKEHVLNMMNSIGRNERGMMQQGTQKDSESLSETILMTGKYWNATLLCEKRNKKAMQIPPPSADDRGAKEEISFAMGLVDMSRYISKQYEIASRTFLNIVMRDYCMLDTLSFMKRYFLLDQGDFFVHFLDMSEDELLQEMPDVSRARVQNWMNVSIQMSGGDAYDSLSIGSDKDPISITSALKIEFATQSLVNHLDTLHSTSGGIHGEELKTPSRTLYGGTSSGLTGVAAFMLDFHQIPFPLSLLLSRQTVTNYQLLFRHLFFAKHVERRLVGTWFDHQVIKEHQSLRQDLGRTYGLRHRMLHFMQNLVYYMMFEVIEPNWLRMESRLMQRNGDIAQREKNDWIPDQSRERQSHRTVDDILTLHNDFVRRTLKECLLTNRDLIRILTKLMTTCLLFSDQMKLFMETTAINQEQDQIATEQRQRRRRKMYEVMEGTDKKKKKIREAIEAEKEERRRRKQKQVDRLHHELNTESYKRMITRFEQVFNLNLREFMSQLMSDSDGRYHTHLSNLCTRLDYNGYLTSSMND